jgi:negative regulator of sigma E activity
LESDHRKTKILISALIDGELRDCEIQDLMLHVNECTKCQTEYKNVLELKQLLDNLKESDTLG